MWFAKYFLLFVYCIIDVSSDSVLTPCNIEDDSCINKQQAAIQKILAGFPERGVKSCDPLYIEKLEGNLPGFTYVFFNTTITGLKDCDITNMKIDPKLKNFHYEMTCPSVKLDGEYQMNGKLITIPVEGNGHFTITTGIYHVTVDSKLQTTASDGKTYLTINETKLKSEVLTPVTYAFDNLYKGRKDEAQRFLKSSNENWKVVQEQADGPVWKTILDNIKINANPYLKSMAL